MPRLDDKILYALPDGTDALLEGTCGAPFSILGRHNAGGVDIVRVFCRDARRVRLLIGRPQGGWGERAMRRIGDTGLYIGHIPAGISYRLKITWADGVEETEDPYSFPPLLNERELELFRNGHAAGLERIMGAHPLQVDTVAGVRFTVWAPHARRVSVIGDFNIWDGGRHPMRLRHEAGIWEIFIPGIGAGERYKYEILDQEGRIVPHKADPFARDAEIPPATASVIASSAPPIWTDATWMCDRARLQADDAPITIYEVHAASWRRPKGDPALTMSWDALASELVPYVQAAGFTHVGFLPVMELLSGGVWECAPLGLFRPSARHGPPEGFCRLVDACHRAGLGVIMDWIPDRLPPDLHGIACFDGTALYEHPHSHPHERSVLEGPPLFYNLHRAEVRGFLISSALMWLEHCHVDGLRVDMRGCARERHDEIISFLRELNEVIAQRVPGALVIASGGSTGPDATVPVSRGGWGFSLQSCTAVPCGVGAYLAQETLWRGGGIWTSLRRRRRRFPGNTSCVLQMRVMRGMCLRCFLSCRGMHGAGMRRGAYICLSCGHGRAGSLCSWDRNSRRKPLGTRMGNCRGMRPACLLRWERSGWWRISITSIVPVPPCIVESASLPALPGSSPMTRPTMSLHGYAMMGKARLF
ncbi:GlgB N-terminal domain-containing protein [Novacetimonas hansenii]|uniref:1,4-alpha-glucan branching enzyme n=1 Tax=Novacetimonas hansenii TaxID=436 RepID=A0AAW5EQF7_NOVHA|nr:hypothetical protein [Novacetimonas hansenii]MCJ8353083.1 hypothetical protein [Novacetimonas hansenii]